MVDQFFRIGCYVGDFKLDYPADQAWKTKYVNQFVCYLGPVTSDKVDIWTHGGKKNPCSDCLCSSKKVYTPKLGYVKLSNTCRKSILI